MFWRNFRRFLPRRNIPSANLFTVCYSVFVDRGKLDIPHLTGFLLIITSYKCNGMDLPDSLEGVLSRTPIQMTGKWGILLWLLHSIASKQPPQILWAFILTSNKSPRFVSLTHQVSQNISETAGGSCRFVDADPGPSGWWCHLFQHGPSHWSSHPGYDYWCKIHVHSLSFDVNP